LLSYSAPFADYSFSYDARNRQTEAFVGAIGTNFLINGLGQRIAQINGSVPQFLFVYDEAGHLAGKYDGQQINAAVDGLKRRYYQIIEDKLNLPPTGPKSVAGHQQQFEDRQIELRDLLTQAATLGCTGYNPDAWDWATCPVPSPAPK
jgi:hypothetical protein